MTLMRWEPLREFGALQSEVNRLFNSAIDGPDARPTGRWIPAMDLIEEADAFVLRADLPGLSEDDVSIEVDEQVLTISGERRVEQEQRGGGVRRLERAAGRFSRSLTLPRGVDADGVCASFSRGVLEVRVTKPQAPSPRRVPISTTQEEPAVVEATGDRELAGAAS